MKKISIVGRGTVGCLSVSHFLKWTDWQIDWIYDPNIQTSSVGEGTNLIFPNALFSNVEYSWSDIEAIGATPKLGIWKRGWGSDKDFHHSFPAGTAAMHFNALAFQANMFEHLSKFDRVNIIESNCVDYENLDSDFVMVCTGSPNLSDQKEEYEILDYIPVNSCHVFQCPWDYPKFNSTLTFARKYGWIFGIPIKNRCSIGYIFNGDLNSIDEVVEDSQIILKEFDLFPSQTRTLKFKNYFKKNNFTKKVAYNGNSSFFLEPLEATSTGFSNFINQLAYDVWNNNLDIELANYGYSTFLDEIGSMISLHYFAGSNYKTEFWKRAVELGKNKIEKDFREKNEFFEIVKQTLQNGTKPSYNRDVGSWNKRSYLVNIEGLNLKEKLQKMIRENE
jgi:hypothetical protein